MIKNTASSGFEVFLANALELGPKNAFDGVGRRKLCVVSMHS